MYESLIKAHTATQKQIDNLTGMRVRDLIDDEGYVKERDRLKAEMVQISSEIARLDSRAENWLELTEQVFDFATYAHVAFLKGEVHKKKEIMMALGSNPTILDGKLSIQPHPWFVPIIESYPALKMEFERLEPAESTGTKCKTDQFALVGSTWLRLLDAFRTVNWRAIRQELEFSGVINYA